MAGINFNSFDNFNKEKAIKNSQNMLDDSTSAKKQHL